MIQNPEDALSKSHQLKEILESFTSSGYRVALCYGTIVIQSDDGVESYGVALHDRTLYHVDGTRLTRP